MGMSGITTLLIDDVREMMVDATVRNAELAKAILAGPVKFDIVYLDHDLGPGENGLDVLRWMFRKTIRPATIILVTMNPAGRKNLEADLRANGYTQTGNMTWRENENQRSQSD